MGNQGIEKGSPRLSFKGSYGFSFIFPSGLDVINLNNVVQLVDPDQPQKIIFQVSKDIIKGKGVGGGKVRGKVQIISNNDYDISNKVRSFKKGRILVTEMTRPQIITICNKAKGIITNEGGVLSHAAIISREFHIPCVMGTKIATKILKNGDEVEVDADNGIVKVIKPYSI